MPDYQNKNAPFYSRLRRSGAAISDYVWVTVGAKQIVHCDLGRNSALLPRQDCVPFCVPRLPRSGASESQQQVSSKRKAAESERLNGEQLVALTGIEPVFED